MAGSCYSQDIIEAHSDIGDDDRLYGSHECISSLGSLFMMFIRSYLTVELPYHIEEEECSEELEPWNLEEKYDSKWEYDTENCRSCHSPEYCPFPFYSLELLRRHTDEDSIISAHDEIDEDDIEQGECSCRSEEMEKVRFEGDDEVCHSVKKEGYGGIVWNLWKMQWFLTGKGRSDRVGNR